MRIAPMIAPNARFETPNAGRSSSRTQEMNGGGENFSEAAV